MNHVVHNFIVDEVNFVKVLEQNILRIEKPEKILFVVSLDVNFVFKDSIKKKNEDEVSEVKNKIVYLKDLDILGNET